MYPYCQDVVHDHVKEQLGIGLKRRPAWKQHADSSIGDYVAGVYLRLVIKRKNASLILIAGGDSNSYNSLRSKVIPTLAHEASHYFQDIEGRNLTEIGVRLRTRNMLNYLGYHQLAKHSPICKQKV